VIGTGGGAWRWLSSALVALALISSGCSAINGLFGEDCPVPDTKVTNAMAASVPRPGVGLNKPDLFIQYLGHASGGRDSAAYQETAYKKVTRAMAEKAIADASNIAEPYLRVSATGYAPSAFDRPGDLDLWREDPTGYWCLFDKMMNDIHSNDVQIVPVFVWNWTQFPAMTSETTAQMINDPNSESYQLLTAYIAEFVNRYEDHPALYFYELTNELNLKADLDTVGRCRGGKLGLNELCEPMGNFSTDQLITFMSRLADHVRSLDPDHPISSGFSLPRPYAEHLRQQPEFSSSGPDFTRDSMTEFRKNLKDIHQQLDIVSVHFYNWEGNNERFGIYGHSNADLLDVVKQTTDEIGKELFVGEFGDVNPYIKDDKNALFTQNVLNKIVELGIPYSAPWVWEFYVTTTYRTYDRRNTYFNLEPGRTDLVIAKIKEANEKLGVPIPSAQTRDNVPPQVVITWPLEGSEMPCNPSIYVIASDNSGSISKVTLSIDGEVEATRTTRPYRFTLKTAQLGLGRLHFTAKAYDASGNSARYAVAAISGKSVLEPIFHFCSS
jgi:hypothetical protein